MFKSQKCPSSARVVRGYLGSVPLYWDTRLALSRGGMRAAIRCSAIGYLLWQELETVVCKVQPDVAV